MARQPRPKSEATVHSRTVRFLKREHPGVAFRTDYAAGVHLNKVQAAIHKSLQWRSSGWPDLQVLALRGAYHADGWIGRVGLFVEIKKDGVRVLRRDGLWADEHLQKQYSVLSELDARGYMAVMVRGYDDICAVLDYYLKPELGVKLELHPKYKLLVTGHTRPAPDPNEEKF